MAERPVYIPQYSGDVLVNTDMIEFTYYNGFSISQKQKSIQSLHATIHEIYGRKKVLEVSSKSEDALGVNLSAFNLFIEDRKSGLKYSVESAFQASKVFEHGGPYIDLLKVSSREAKKDLRIKNSGELKKFIIYNREWPLRPLTAFYDWLYINALKVNEQYHEELLSYDFFTDIEFNPKKSINCQAYSIAMFCSLAKRGLLDRVRNPDEFLDLYKVFKPNNTSTYNKSINGQQSIEF